MQRIKSLDSFRGFIMLVMVWVHLCDWWIREEDFWFSKAILPIIQLTFGPGFLLLAGISITLSYRNSLIKITKMHDFNYNILRKEYLFRATFILIVALGYNSIVALNFMNPLDLWKWFILLTMAISLFLVWPLLKLPKQTRLVIAVIIWVINCFLFKYLLPFQGQANVFGTIYYFLYNSIDVIPFPHYFSFLLIGTALGEIFFDIYQIKDQKERKLLIKKKIILPFLILGFTLIIIGVALDPQLALERTSFIWIMLAMGISLLSLSTFIVFVDFKLLINKSRRSFKFLFYYSYYSLTVYLVHNIFYFFFLHQLNLFQFWILTVITCLVFGFILQLIYNKIGPKFSIKVQLGRLSSGLAKKLEKEKAYS